MNSKGLGTSSLVIVIIVVIAVSIGGTYLVMSQNSEKENPEFKFGEWEITIGQDDELSGDVNIGFDYMIKGEKNLYFTVLRDGNDFCWGRLLSQETHHRILLSYDFATPKGGTYELIVHPKSHDTWNPEEVETLYKRTFVFEGPKPSIESVSLEWDGNTLGDIEVKIANKGDLPVYVWAIGGMIGDRDVGFNPTDWVEGDETKTVSGEGPWAIESGKYEWTVNCYGIEGKILTEKTITVETP